MLGCVSANEHLRTPVCCLPFSIKTVVARVPAAGLKWILEKKKKGYVVQDKVV